MFFLIAERRFFASIEAFFRISFWLLQAVSPEAQVAHNDHDAAALLISCSHWEALERHEISALLIDA